MDRYDAAIVGGGPAGLSAAIYLTRLNYRTVVLAQGKGQTGWHQTTENYFGFPRGIPAAKLTALGTRQATRCGAHVMEVAVDTIRRTRGGFTLHAGRKLTARAIILCTGVSSSFPVFPNFERYVGRSLFDCLVCHGATVRGSRTMVTGHDDASALTCLQLRRFTPRPVLFTNCEKNSHHLSQTALARLKKARIRILHGIIAGVRGSRGMMREVILSDGRTEAVDFMFSRQSRRPNSTLGAQLGVLTEGEGYLCADRDQRTNQKLVYAAGDVCSANNHQIVCAAQQGAIAALSAYEDLARPDQRPW